jgi:hypothetical protein
MLRYCGYIVLPSHVDARGVSWGLQTRFKQVYRSAVLRANNAVVRPRVGERGVAAASAGGQAQL